MATRTIVNVAITPELDAFLSSHVPSGRYQTTSEVVRSALRLLEHHELKREDAVHRFKVKLERGAGSRNAAEPKARNSETADIAGRWLVPLAVGTFTMIYSTVRMVSGISTRTWSHTLGRRSQCK